MTSTPTALVHDFRDALNAQDADALGDLFTDDAIFVNVMGMGWIGGPAIAESHRWAFEGPLKGAHFTVGPVETTRVTGDVEVVHATFQRLSGHDAGVESLPDATTVMVMTARRADDDWRVVSMCNHNPPTHTG